MRQGATSVPEAASPFLPQTLKILLAGLFALTVIVWFSSRTLLSTNFLPHWYCFVGNQRLLWTNVIADFLIGASYVAISTTLVWLVRRAGKDLPYSKFFWAFGVFIVSCGVTHFLEIVTIWMPIYWVSAAAKSVTALASVGTSIILLVASDNIIGFIGRAKEAGALRDNERFRAQLEAMPMAVIAFDLEKRITAWNLAAEQTFGWKAAEVAGAASPAVPPGLEQEHQELLGKALAGVTTRGVETIRSNRRGERLAVRMSTAPLYSEEGNVVGVLRVLEDISQQKQIERAIEKEESRLASIIGTAMDAVITVDEQQCVTLFNPAAEKMFGCTASEALGQRLERFIPKRFHAAHAEHIRHFGRNQVTRRKMGELGSIYGLRSNGEEFSIEASISHSEVAGEKLFTVILRDVTERKRAEEELRQHASILELAPVLVRDMENRILFWTHGAEELYGYTRAEAVGQVSHDLLRTEFPEPLERIQKILAEEGNWEGELIHRNRNGRPINVASKWVLYRDASGTPIRILQVSTDITDRKRVEAAQLRSQKLEGLGTLAGGIAHDFNNILLAINGNAKLAILDLPAEHPAQESLTEISKAGARAAGLVKRILAFSRPDEQKREVHQLQPVVEEALKLVRATLPAMIQIETSFASGLPPVAVDATQIHQVMVNLATNAAHAIGVNAGVIKVQSELVKLHADDVGLVAGLREGAYVRLFVSDSGCGMNRTTMERIFDPFFTTKPVGEGTGLGLSVVHGIMTSHGGAITVYSEPGKGTAFHLYFPVAEHTAETEAPKGGNMERQHTERILYVDDEEGLVHLFTRTLKRLGYQVTGFTDAEAALREFRERPGDFAVVVTDLSMPRMSGLELARELLKVRADVPIVLTSGYLRREEEEAANRAGIRAVILKPATVEELGTVLDGIFQERGLVTTTAGNQIGS